MTPNPAPKKLMSRDELKRELHELGRGYMNLHYTNILAAFDALEAELRQRDTFWEQKIGETFRERDALKQELDETTKAFWRGVEAQKIVERERNNLQRRLDEAEAALREITQPTGLKAIPAYKRLREIALNYFDGTRQPHQPESEESRAPRGLGKTPGSFATCGVVSVSDEAAPDIGGPNQAVGSSVPGSSPGVAHQPQSSELPCRCGHSKSEHAHNTAKGDEEAQKPTALLGTTDLEAALLGIAVHANNKATDHAELRGNHQIRIDGLIERVQAHDVELRQQLATKDAALRFLLEVIDKGGGPVALSRGVDLGQASYARKLTDAVERAQSAFLGQVKG